MMPARLCTRYCGAFGRDDRRILTTQEILSNDMCPGLTFLAYAQAHWLVPIASLANTNLVLEVPPPAYVLASFASTICLAHLG
jgi:hypothetical protein